MKKICILTVGLALMASNVFAAPQTDIKQGETAIDISVFNSKDALGSFDYDKKANIDLGITTGISDKYAIQYKYHSLESDFTPSGSFLLKDDVKMQEVNVLYKLTPNTDAFIGIHRFSGKHSSVGLGTADYDTENKVQVGITTTVPLSKSLNAWGTVAAGDDLVNCELGLSHPLAKNTNLNVYYRYTKEKDLMLPLLDSKVDFENNGFGLGITTKF